MQVDLCDDDDDDEKDEEAWTPQKLPNKPQGRWRPPTLTAEQKKKGWMPGIQEESKNSKGQVSQLMTEVKNHKVTATSYTDDAWEAFAREMGIFVDSKGALRAPIRNPQSLGPAAAQEQRGRRAGRR